MLKNCYQTTQTTILQEKLDFMEEHVDGLASDGTRAVAMLCGDVNLSLEHADACCQNVCSFARIY